MFLGRVQALKKSVSKGDKKRKKEVSGLVAFFPFPPPPFLSLSTSDLPLLILSPFLSLLSSTNFISLTWSLPPSTPSLPPSTPSLPPSTHFPPSLPPSLPPLPSLPPSLHPLPSLSPSLPPSTSLPPSLPPLPSLPPSLHFPPSLPPSLPPLPSLPPSPSPSSGNHRNSYPRSRTRSQTQIRASISRGQDPRVP